MDPAYDRVAPIFQMLPYVAGGVVVGLISGFGYFNPVRLAIRFAGVIALFAISYVYNGDLAVRGLLPAAGVSFLISTVISLVYFRLIARQGGVKT